jgi:predicted RNA-binding protein YlxR (DUF448 family)
MPRRSEPGERTCVVTRVAMRPDALIRFVAAPDGEIVADLKRNLPGRGVWVTARRDVVATAERKHLLARALAAGASEKPAEAGHETPVAHVSPGLADRVDGLLLAAATGALAFARKAGALIGGFAKVEAALGSESVVALVHAAEAGEDGVAKLRAAARRRFGDGKLPVIRCFGGEQLDLAFGRTNVIHAALLAGPAGDNVLARVGDLVRFRGDGLPDGWPNGAGAPITDAPIEVNDLSAGS